MCGLTEESPSKGEIFHRVSDRSRGRHVTLETLRDPPNMHKRSNRTSAKNSFHLEITIMSGARIVSHVDHMCPVLILKKERKGKEKMAWKSSIYVLKVVP